MKRKKVVHRTQLGFTLIEVITVVVILSIVAVLGSTFVATSVEKYDRVQQRSKMINRARQSIERITRQLRASLPHGIRVDGGGLCIEFMPVAGGGNYLGPDYLVAGVVQNELPTLANGAVPGAPYAVRTAPFDINVGGAQHITVGAMAAGEIYSAANPSSREEIGGIGALGVVSVPLNGAHRFMRNSINKRFFVVGDPGRFCVTGSQLFYYDNYGMPVGGFVTGQPGGSAASLLADNIGPLGAITPFQVSAATQDRNSVVNITIPFASRDGAESAIIKQSVMIRNVP